MSRRRYRIKNKGAAALRIALLLGLVLLLLGGIYGVIRLLGSNGKAADAQQLPFTRDSNYTFTGSGFLYMYEDRLHYDDLEDAKKDASYQVSTDSVTLSASPTLLALYHDSAVQIIGAAESLSFSQQVQRVECGQEHVVVLLQKPDGSSALHIYDSQGAQTDQMDFAKDTLVDFGFAQTGDGTLWTLEMQVSASEPLSTITTYNLAANRTTGVMNVQGQLVDRVFFTEKSIFLSCTTDLIRYNRTGNTEAYRLLIYGYELCDVSTGGSSPTILLRPRGAATSEGAIKLYALPEGDVADAAITEMQLPSGTISAFLSKGRLMACTRDALHTYALSGKETGLVSLPRTADKVEKLSESHMLLHCGNGLYVSPLQ